jgi:hypothetical protein
MNNDRDLFSAVQADLLDPAHLARALTSADPAKPLADLVVEQSWLTVDDGTEVVRLLDRKLKKRGGDARAGLQTRRVITCIRSQPQR